MTTQAHNTPQAPLLEVALSREWVPSPALVAWAEDYLARRGYAVVSVETMRAIERIEAAPYAATEREYSEVLYAIYSGPLGEYHPRKVFA